ncbi:MAG: AI-2E family transporter [Lachnospiraceae bacterium]|nr:AI-2E family transporter [Lachnospiraceae bacterium]
MGFSKEKIKQICLLMAFGALLVLAVIYSDLIFRGIAIAFSIASPFLIGGVIAFVLNLPMKMVEEKLLVKWKGKLAAKLKRPISMLLSIIFVLLIIVLVVVTVVPQIQSAASVLGQKIPPFIDGVVDELVLLSEKYPQMQEQVTALKELELNWESIANTAIGFLKNGVASMLTSTVSVASGIIGGVVNTVISVIFALYILSQKEKLANQGKRILSAYLPAKANAYVLKVLTLAYKNFSKFISGQCLEAVILGIMFIIAMSVFRMPYAFMVGVLIAFTALIPVVGAFIGCAVGAFLILIENPMLALWFIILFLILQQLEGNLIYPKVVGNSVGLPSIWVLMAVSLGGSLFGVAGMLFFIPLLSTCYALLRESVNTRNASRGAQEGDTLETQKPITEKVQAPEEKQSAENSQETEKKQMLKNRKKRKERK